VYVESFDGTTAGLNWANTVINADPDGDPNATTFVSTNTNPTFNTYGYTLKGFTLEGPDNGSSIGASNGTSQGSAYTGCEVHNCVIRGFNYGVGSDRRAMTVQNCLIYDNIYGWRHAGTQPYTLYAYNCTITDNTYGIYAYYDPIDTYNSIVWGNTTVDYRARYMGYSSGWFDDVVIKYSDVGTYDSINVTDPNNWAWDLSDNIDADPNFVGGAGADAYKLDPNDGGSPCHDAASNDYVDNEDRDLWGSYRRMGVAVDMGAHELAGNVYPD
ncbi:unnamed protein product, partial [marine sediment metagenome]